MSRWLMSDSPRVAIPAFWNAACSSSRVRWLPPHSSFVSTASQRLKIAWSRPKYRYRYALNAWMRGAVRAQHPADVGGSHEVPRRPQHVSSQNVAIVEGLLDAGVGRATQAHADIPTRCAIVLR